MTMLVAAVKATGPAEELTAATSAEMSAAVAVKVTL